MIAEIHLNAAFLIFFYMISWFLLAQWLKDNGIVDVAWGMGFILVSFVTEFFYRIEPNYILLIIVTIWGLRLALHIGVRNLGRGEDWRYANWRKDWKGQVFWQSLVRVFLLQGFFMFIIALPLLYPGPVTTDLQWFQYIGLLLWLVGLLWESIGDWQLLRFKKNPANKGKIMMEGLWSLSRHPNYFGEMTLWWGIFIYVAPFGHWYISILSPIVLTWLLMRISGVPMLEAKYKDNPDYQKYVKKTNALLPKVF